jgi:hypothetical protein
VIDPHDPKTTREELITYINEAPNLQERTLRKQECFYRLYSSAMQPKLLWPDKSKIKKAT